MCRFLSISAISVVTNVTLPWHAMHRVCGRRDGRCLPRVWIDATTSVIHQYFFMKHHLRWTPPLMLTVYSRLDRGIQSATEMLPLRRGEGVVHSFYCTLHLSICALLTHLFITCLLAAVHLSFHLSVPCLSDYWMCRHTVVLTCGLTGGSPPLQRRAHSNRFSLYVYIVRKSHYRLSRRSRVSSGKERFCKSALDHSR